MSGEAVALGRPRRRGRADRRRAAGRAGGPRSRTCGRAGRLGPDGAIHGIPAASGLAVGHVPRAALQRRRPGGVDHARPLRPGQRRRAGSAHHLDPRRWMDRRQQGQGLRTAGRGHDVAGLRGGVHELPAHHRSEVAGPDRRCQGRDPGAAGRRGPIPPLRRDRGLGGQRRWAPGRDGRRRSGRTGVGRGANLDGRGRATLRDLARHPGQRAPRARVGSCGTTCRRRACGRIPEPGSVRRPALRGVDEGLAEVAAEHCGPLRPRRIGAGQPTGRCGDHQLG